MNYDITDMRKIKKCPKCRRYKPGSGNKCLCGFDWADKKPTGKVTRINKNIPRCKCCNMPGDHGGFCEMHYEQQAEFAYRQRMESYRVPGKNDHEINVLTGKVIPEIPKQEEANDTEN